ncbi:GvpL/GvpF family gas vesicle protein [Oscillatoria sp. FACHB-1407]|uniref:GvpL/GvpF family gas vesicle protein n=1 Tax=Oscillatoria sp. FACHB-1407 TaxID=2692847 RepID=UPI001689B620|nr:GvpL/GvpF family gas vesicle protein [Oscillatoria sp. FACHB-1407]MBD2460080.1 GvpL/GvpF family gas vesicle protein [Oscillatoria sp. FACHB-1407]
MGIYTYAFLLHSAEPLELPTGITGSLHLIEVRQLCALVEPGLAFEELQQNDSQLLQAIIAHDRVLQEVFQQADILPLRFGTQFVSEAGLLQHLEANHSLYLDKFSQLKGQAEYVLKFIPVEKAEPEISSDIKGKDYFLAKKQRYQSQLEQQHQRQQELDEVKEAIAQSFHHTLSESKDGVERVYLLADRTHEITLQNQIQQWQDLCTLWSISLGNALPPYHFV